MPRTTSDLEFVQEHRRIWAARPELRAVYQGFFSTLLAALEGRHPAVELGAGPGFLKEYCPTLLSTDVIGLPWVDIVCDACRLPIRSESMEAFVLLDVLHHLPFPLQFMTEAARVLRRGGRIAMIEPWITPASYVLYRYFHHEDCKLGIDIENPFETERTGKKAFDGNAAIPYKVVKHFSKTSSPFRLLRCEPFLGLSYLATLGFQRSRPMPKKLIDMAGRCERLLGPLGRWNATRALLVWQKD